MAKDTFDSVKEGILNHVQSMFEEIEESMAMKHQEKFSLLEDAFENATDVSELKIAFEQWHIEHAEDLELEATMTEMWEQAIAQLEDTDGDDDVDDSDEEDEDENEDEEDKK